MRFWCALQCIARLTTIPGHHRPPNCAISHRIPSTAPHAVHHRMSRCLPTEFLLKLAAHIPHITHLHWLVRARSHRPLLVVLPLYIAYRIIQRTSPSIRHAERRDASWIQGNRVVLRHLRLARPIVPLSQSQRQRQCSSDYGIIRYVLTM